MTSNHVPPTTALAHALTHEPFPAYGSVRILMSSRFPGPYRNREFTINGTTVCVEYLWY